MLWIIFLVKKCEINQNWLKNYWRNGLTNEQKIWKRNCPKCSKELIYKYSSGFYIARKENRMCKLCAKIGNNNPMYGNIPLK